MGSEESSYSTRHQRGERGREQHKYPDPAFEDVVVHQELLPRPPAKVVTKPKLKGEREHKPSKTDGDRLARCGGPNPRDPEVGHDKDASAEHYRTHGVACLITDARDEHSLAKPTIGDSDREQGTPDDE
jgi:hypothetical protein